MEKANSIEQAKQFFSIRRDDGLLCKNSYKERVCYTFSSACDFFNEKNHY